MASQFTYSIANDTLNGAVASVKLQNEIRASIITIALQGVTLSGDNLIIDFKTDISSGEETTLDGLVAAHDGRRSIDDVQKFQIVDQNQEPIGRVDDAGTMRLAIDVGNASIVGAQGPQGDTGPQGPQGPQGPTSTFGSEYNYAESLTESSTTSNSPVNKLTLSLTSLPSGTYRLNWSYNWSGASTSVDFRAEIELDSTQIMYHSQEPKDSGTDQQIPASGFIPNLNLNGNHTVDLNFWEEGGSTAYIRDARLELWRIS